MKLEERVRLTIGDLVIQLQAAQMRIEELEQQLGKHQDVLTQPHMKPREVREAQK